MKLARQLGLSGLVLALSSAPALAQTEGLAKVGSLIQGVFAGIFNGITSTPEVWMKVILGTLLWVVLYVVIGTKVFKESTKNVKIVLSLAVAIAAVAPIPNALIRALFGALGFVGVIFYILPVVGIIYWTNSISKGEKERHPYVVCLIIWLVTWFIYINGLGSTLAAEVGYMSTAQGLLNLVALGYTIYYISIVSVGARPASPEAVTKAKERMARLEKATKTPAKTRVDGWLRAVKSARALVEDVRKTVPAPADANEMIRAQPRLKAALATFNGAVVAVRRDRALTETLNEINASTVAQLDDYLRKIGPVADALQNGTSVRARPLPQLFDYNERLIALFGRGAVLETLLSRVVTDLEALKA